MQHESRYVARLAPAVAIALLLCLPGAGFAQDGRVSMQGRITSMVPQGSQFQVTLDNGGYTWSIPRYMVLDRHLNVGDIVRLDGNPSAGVITVDNALFVSGQQPAVAYGANLLSGVVQSTNRKLGYVTVRDQGTRKDIKIDVRRMNEGQSINVWNLKRGDRIAAEGAWENGDTFQANRVSFNAVQRTAGTDRVGSALTGVVQGANRDLNYLTVRDNATGRDLKVDVRRMNTRESVNVWNLKAGDPIIVNGSWENGTTFRASRVNVSSYPPMTSSSVGAAGLTGTVQSLNRNLNYVTIRSDMNGQPVKIDVRSMDTRQSVNVWNLRAGDRIVVNGSWENRDTFQASTISF